MTADRGGRVAFRLLGEMEVWQDNQKIDLGGVKQRGVLAVLLSQPNRLVTRQKIIDLVWSRDEQDRLGSVEKLVPDYLSRSRNCLRRAGISEELVRLAAVRNRQPGYQVTVDLDAEDAAVTLDWQQFGLHRARGKVARDAGDIQDAVGCFSAALGLWRGTALEGLGPVLEPIRREMTNGRLTTAEDLAAICLEHGDPQQAVLVLEELAVEHPGRERTAALLIRALGLIGRPDDAFVVHERTQAHLANVRGVDATGVLQRAYQDILHRERSGDVESSTRHGRSDLPYDTRHFLGRDREVRQLCGVLSDPANTSRSVVICAIDGMAGVGKTALAVHVAHEIGERFPDGVLFLDLHGHNVGTQPIDAAAALGALLRRIGVSSEKIPAEHDERAALWRSRMAGKRTLILLDNARDAAQLEPLLPGTAGCSVLITSRRRLVLDDAHTLTLDVLGPADAIALLGRIAGNHAVGLGADSAEKIVELCGYLPLAIRIIAARLRAHPKLLRAGLVQRLDDPRQRLAELVDGTRRITEAFASSYHRLSDDQRRMFRSFGRLPVPDVDAQMAAVLADMDVRQARRCLDELLDASMVSQRAGERVRIHDLLRCYAAELDADYATITR